MEQQPFLLQNLSRSFDLHSFCKWLNNNASYFQNQVKHKDIKAHITYSLLQSTLNGETGTRSLVPEVENHDALEQRIQVKQFGFGQSNPTFLVRVYPMSNEKVDVFQFVLRQKPLKSIHRSAHAIHREFSVLLALSSFLHLFFFFA